jgi:hypothetical protein
VTTGVDPELDVVRVVVDGQCLARVEERFEAPLGTGSRPGQPELDVAPPAAGLRAGAQMTHGHTRQVRRVVQQDDLAEVLALHGADLALEVKALVRRGGQLPARVEGSDPLGGWELGVPDGPG